MASIVPWRLKKYYYGTSAGSAIDATYSVVGESGTQSAADQFFLSSATGGYSPPPYIRAHTPQGRLSGAGRLRNQRLRRRQPRAGAQYKNAEYYYGFAAYYGNVTCREFDRRKDPDYPAAGSAEEKEAFMNLRTVEGLSIFLAETVHHLQGEVGGVERRAKLTVTICQDPLADRQNVVWAYTPRCTVPGRWEFVERRSDDGSVDRAT